MAATSRGVLVAYRDRDAGERRDIALARWENGRWSAPWPLHRDGWVLRGCPVNGPALDADGATVVAAWFTGADKSERVLAAFSSDAGQTFGEPIEVSASDPAGRVGVALLGDGSAVVSWIESGGHETRLQARRVTREGEGPARTIAALPGIRGLGFPRVMRDGARVVFAWTEPGEVRRVRTAAVATTAFGGARDRAARRRSGDTATR
jgi:hypothetical protein